MRPAPALLGNLWVSAALLAVAVGATALAAWFTRKPGDRAQSAKSLERQG
jgi:hypothetical protein